MEDLPRGAVVAVPEVSKLTVNYRTHNGILGAASQLVSLLLELFPHSVDALEKDVGHFDGPLPTLLTDTSKDDLSMLLFGSDPQHSQIEFGAHQVVLVRDQAAKANLPVELQSALALTIFEAKVQYRLPALSGVRPCHLTRGRGLACSHDPACPDALACCSHALAFYSHDGLCSLVRAPLPRLTGFGV